MQDEEYIHNEEAGSTAEDFLIDKTVNEDVIEFEVVDMICPSCGGHEVGRMQRGATPQDLVYQYECTSCGTTWES